MLACMHMCAYLHTFTSILREGERDRERERGVCAYIYICICIYVYVCMYACMYVCIYVCISIHAWPSAAAGDPVFDFRIPGD